MSLKNRKLYIVFISTFLFGLIAHGFCYSNLLLNHDSLMVSQANDAFGWQISLGRFAQVFYLYFRRYMATPWLIGMLQLLFISLQTLLIVDLLEIKKTHNIIIVSAILITNYTVALSNATYIYLSDIYALSQLLATLSIYVLVKIKCNVKYPLSIIFIVGALGLYQSNIQIAITLIIILSIKEILEGVCVKGVVKNLVFGLIVVVVGCALYYLCNRLVLLYKGIPQSTGYNSVNNVFEMISNPGLIIDRVSEIINYEISWIMGLNTPLKAISTVINIILILVLIASVVMLYKKNHLQKSNLLMLIVLLAILPFCIGITGILSGVFHDLMAYSIFLVYVLIIVVVEMTDYLNIHKILMYIQIGLFSILVFINCVFSNVQYFKKELINEQTISFFTRLIINIENTDGYKINKTPVMFIGEAEKNPTIKTRDEFYEFTGAGTECKLATTYHGLDEKYISETLSYPMNFVGYDAGIAESEPVKSMPVYPAKGSIKIVDGILVVKLS